MGLCFKFVVWNFLKTTQKWFAFGYIPLKISILMAAPLYRKYTPIIALFWIISIPNMHQCFRGVRHYTKLANIPCSQSVFHLFIYSFVRIISSSLITYLAHCNKCWHNISACTLQWGPHSFREWKYLFTFEAEAKTPQTFSSKMWAISMPFACGKCILHDFWILAGSSEKISRLYGWILHVEYSTIKNMQNSKINGFQHSTHTYIMCIRYSVTNTIHFNYTKTQCEHWMRFFLKHGNSNNNYAHIVLNFIKLQPA